jgi:hypothetical protein
MALGTVLVSAGLFALGHVRSGPAYLAVWAFLGLGMRLCLYDAAFAALVQVAPRAGGRRSPTSRCSARSPRRCSWSATRSLGLTIPPALFSRADRVIE